MFKDVIVSVTWLEVEKGLTIMYKVKASYGVLLY